MMIKIDAIVKISNYLYIHDMQHDVFSFEPKNNFASYIDDSMTQEIFNAFSNIVKKLLEKNILIDFYINSDSPFLKYMTPELKNLILEYITNNTKKSLVL